MFEWLLKRNKMKREIIINVESLQTRVAVLENGRLEEFQIENTDRERIVGNIYKGRIQNLEHDLQAAFVDIGLRKNAFLHYWDMIPDSSANPEFEDNDRNGRGRQSRRKKFSNEEIEQRFPVGSELVVQVTKGPIGTKGPRVTASLSIPGRYLVVMPGEPLKGVSRKIEDAEERARLKKILDRLPIPNDAGVIVRTAGSGARNTSFARDLRALVAAWTDIRTRINEWPAPCCVYEEPDICERVVRDWLTEDVDRIALDDRERYEGLRTIAGKIARNTKSKIILYEGTLPVFDHYEVEKQLEETSRRKVTLKSGGCIVFDETEALVAIDVNSGRHKGKGSQEDAILEVNIEAVEEVARQLRLRNIGGLIVLDLIDMKARKHQAAVYRAMKEALKRDRARTNVLPISALGIMEMTRQRTEESILATMYSDCPYCHGRGTVKSAMGMSVEIQRQIAAIQRRRKKGADQADLLVLVNPTILERLRREDEEFLLDLQERFNCRLNFRADPARHMESFCINNAASGETLFAVSER